jgi:hypothetical protein
MPSTVIRAFSYDERKHELLVVFQSRRRYVYREVPEPTFAAMKAATSKGAFFNRHIRDQFAFSREDDDESAAARVRH